MLLTVAVSAALAGLSGCNRDADRTTSSAPPPATTPSPTTPPRDTTAIPPSTTTPSTGTDRTAGQAVDDAGVTAKVKAALMAASGVDSNKINVDTFNGRVTLKGEGLDKTQIDRAVQVARGVEGVRDVDNRLTTAGAG
jgi:pectin methylesterase-like acyl-CoA thioesterase